MTERLIGVLALLSAFLVAGCMSLEGPRAAKRGAHETKTCKVEQITSDEHGTEAEHYYLRIACVGYHILEAKAKLSPDLKKTKAGHRVRVRFLRGSKRSLDVVAFENLSLR